MPDPDLSSQAKTLRALRDDAQERDMPVLANVYQEQVLQNWKARLIRTLRGGDKPCST